jgi:hypothetical protein
MVHRPAVSIEKAIQLPSFPGPVSLEEYSRLYIGDGFCERLTPEISGLREILDFIRRKNKRITFLTAYYTDRGLKSLQPVLEALNSCGLEVEVVVNDLGALRIINKRFLNLIPVFGRLCTASLIPIGFTDNRVFNPNSPTLEFYRKKFDLSKEYFEFLNENNIKRVEFDSVFALPLFAERFVKEGLAVSLHYPFTCVTTSRRCLFAGRNCFSTKFALLGCKKECLDYNLVLRNNKLEQNILVNGNTQFICREVKSELIEECGKWGVDRIVATPISQRTSEFLK